ncbi:MAG: polysaccharide pyruvyl transferase family protein [Mojavia pulchra JT2-VF2]|jgi:polysaccharide pyruvyl transferase WcaK-like protein|uniref:Polysaccharide pyruvyl transferase family protein n=1 Tax=Mojavia pulchra JT2-VF2 TaxID=287848 RepID=A0A951PXI6_9NOST|nr:polysaccharide pyruvyl transferase family protein [Mojavia pulchra JT2-VF2]
MFSLKKFYWNWKKRLMQRFKVQIVPLYLSTYVALQKVIRQTRVSGDKFSSVLILPPAPPGSLGDEALLTATVEYFKMQGAKRIGIVTYESDSQWANISLTDDETTSLNYHYLHEYLSSPEALFHFAHAVSSYECFYCIGADVMDGYYSEKDTLQRLKFVSMANAMGVKAAVVSFSFNDKPIPNVIQSLQELPSDIRLCSRDLISYQRLIHHLKRPVELGADLAFLLNPDMDTEIVESISQWVCQQRANNRIVVGINANYKLIDELEVKTLDQLIKTFVDTLIGLYSKNEKLSFLLIPHDFRNIGEKNSDVFLAEAILEVLPSEIRTHCTKVPTPCSAREIKAICRNLDIVLSGRMHLAIACLGQETPAACITYQGKFEGLYKHFELDGMTIEPQQALQPGNLVNFFMPLIEKRDDIRKHIRAKLPNIQKLAKANFG